MAELKFRDLNAEEIECRIAMVKANGLSLLLYKDARCDMNILDETVGAYNWKRQHSRENANCIVSIWDETKAQWISKEDTGTESNTEAAKGLASDSFKRACFNWGIGRELYTAPFIWVTSERCNITNGKCYDKFRVEAITIKDKKIVGLTIVNEATGAVVYEMKKAKKPSASKPEPAPAAKPASKPEPAPVQGINYRNELRKFIEEYGLDKKDIITKCGLNDNSTNEEWKEALRYAITQANERRKNDPQG